MIININAIKNKELQCYNIPKNYFDTKKAKIKEINKIILYDENIDLYEDDVIQRIATINDLYYTVAFNKIKENDRTSNDKNLLAKLDILSGNLQNVLVIKILCLNALRIINNKNISSDLILSIITILENDDLIIFF